MAQHIEESAHLIYRYRVANKIQGNSHTDKELARLFLDSMKHGDQRTFDKFIYDYFKAKNGERAEKAN